MDKIKLEEFIKSLDIELDINTGKQFPEITVPASKLYQLARQLIENKDMDFDFLVCLSGVDYGNDLGVVYHLRSTKHGHAIVLKSRTSDRVKPEFPSVADIWRTAEFHER